MAHRDGPMNEIIKKMYAEELDLIVERPIVVKERRRPFSYIKAKIWSRHSTAIKLAIVASTMAFLSALVYYYNLFTIEHFKVRLESAQIEAELQRRNDLIPSLVRAVSEYMEYEGKIFRHAADVRSALNALKSIPHKSPSALSIHSSLAKFQAVAENYPDLKSSATYQSLMKELSDTETRIAEARIKYNHAVNYYNSRLKMFPAVGFGCILGFRAEKAFESEKTAGTAPAVK